MTLKLMITYCNWKVKSSSISGTVSCTAAITIVASASPWLKNAATLTAVKSSEAPSPPITASRVEVLSSSSDVPERISEMDTYIHNTDKALTKQK